MVSGPILNKVENAGLITLDIHTLVGQEKRIELDLAGWLDDGFLVKESSFKKRVENLAEERQKIKEDIVFYFFVQRKAER